MERLILVQGPGGQGRDVLDAIQAAGGTVVGVIDEGPAGSFVLGVPVLGPPSAWRTYAAEGHAFVLSHGQGERRALAAEIRAAGGKVASVLHPRATISPHARLGEGVIVLAGVVIAPDAVVGELSIINANSSIDHDCVLGAAVQFGPGVTLAGVVRVGDEAFLGVGASVMPGVSIGARAVVGAGAG
ncbi:MAG TPA: NeuD/PglB/VioB family sugar acetyltransferase, partial [Lacipirellulaceae bacterium]|nr:NeuD/PglB/VioB family sugar acetyltransferase [Lacipirellulaceae bacterium]